MNLQIKFNIVLGLFSIVGIAISTFFCHQIIQKSAYQETLNTARMMMQSAMAIRHYTSTEIAPLLSLQQKRQFIKQSVPAYAANQFISKLQETYSAYNYREATLNPKNPLNRAIAWEADIIHWFRGHPAEKKLSGLRETPTGPALYLSQPITVSHADCLSCHGTPATAPITLLESYGTGGGFGWKPDEVVGAQIVSVPLTVLDQRMGTTFYGLFSVIISVFIVLIIGLNSLFHYWIIKPLSILSDHTNLISMGELSIAEISMPKTAPFNSINHSINRLHRSLLHAFELLEEYDSEKSPDKE